jgi:ubiquinone/menaquinone biosynthesis C-methylase UbiE
MADWISKLFVEHSDLFMKLMNQRWGKTEQLVDGIINILKDFSIKKGKVLDLFCGNGRTSIYMARKGFMTVGVDISPAFIQDARRKAKELGVSRTTSFIQGDARKLKQVLGEISEPFNVVTSVWTSIGFYSEKDDLRIFKQARRLSRKDSILFIAETAHTEYFSAKFAPTSFVELEDTVMLEDRKYDPITAEAATNWSFYKKSGSDLKFIAETEIRHHVYSLSELSALLRKAGWRTVAAYGSLSTLQPMTPLTHMNIVAKAI